MMRSTSWRSERIDRRNPKCGAARRQRAAQMAVLAFTLGGGGKADRQQVSFGGASRDRTDAHEYGSEARILAGGRKLLAAYSRRFFARRGARHGFGGGGACEKGTQMDSGSPCQCDQGGSGRKLCRAALTLGRKSQRLSVYLFLCLPAGLLSQHTRRPRRCAGGSP